MSKGVKSIFRSEEMDKKPTRNELNEEEVTTWVANSQSEGTDQLSRGHRGRWTELDEEGYSK